ncbi:MAG: FxLYD domain-containing protein [Candidatus Berkelbacteria bacterium]|nr:FxLYD domain-containing protein [Candidatus Berkelbacteria bacterium]
MRANDLYRTSRGTSAKDGAVAVTVLLLLLVVVVGAGWLIEYRKNVSLTSRVDSLSSQVESLLKDTSSTSSLTTADGTEKILLDDQGFGAATGGGLLVTGTARNNDKVKHRVTLEATIKNFQGKVISKVSTTVSNIEVGQSAPYAISASRDQAAGFSQVDVAVVSID